MTKPYQPGMRWPTIALAVANVLLVLGLYRYRGEGRECSCEEGDVRDILDHLRNLGIVTGDATEGYRVSW